ncbi:MAG TPA: DUF2249 domain-containing protein [Candidatus Bathyarchaeia archaeon]|nr:DUF2249 domain-containing protein [Candidatus Bathyarchaeia archaeon]
MNRGAGRPDALTRLPEASAVHLDVREDIRRGREPIARIMSAVKALGAAQVLVLRAPFEPVPLYAALGKRGFAHWTERRADDDWSVWFYREPAAPAAPREPIGRDQEALDIRGLEPPEPMLRVLERLDTLAPGESVTVLHDRRPVFLYPQLDARGFLHDTEDLERGLVRIVIRRAEAEPS